MPALLAIPAGKWIVAGLGLGAILKLGSSSLEDISNSAIKIGLVAGVGYVAMKKLEVI